MKATEASVQSYCKSTFEEVSQFIHTLHSDFESFLKKHKKEHAELTERLRELESKTTLDDNKHAEVRNSVEHYATVLSCLVEFCNIE